MLGVYMQRSWVILLVTVLIMVNLYIFATPLLLLIGQTEDIAHVAGKMALWMIPQLFAYALNSPIAKFLQAQSKIMVMACIAGVALVLHTVFSWLFMLKLGWGLVGGAKPVVVVHCGGANDLRFQWDVWASLVRV